MNDYEKFEIDKICFLLRHFIDRYQALYSTLENYGDNFLVMDPDEMNLAFRDIFNIYTECDDKLQAIDSQLGSVPFLYMSEKSQKLLHNEIASYLNGMECMYDLNHLFGGAFWEYNVSGSSGNPADVSGILAWQGAFCGSAQETVTFCERMLHRLEKINEEIKNRLEEVNNVIKHKEKMATMVCLYASPEEMRKINDIKERTDEYPFIHAVDSEKTGKFCVNCGKFVSMSTVICPYCGNNVQIARDTESLMVSVYASPEMMSKPEKKKSFFSKLFSRKK